MNTLIVIGIAAGAAVLLLIGIMLAIKAFRKVPEGDEALVRTGGSEPVVSTGGGLWVIPMLHRMARVSLQAIPIAIDRTKEDAVPSKDMIPAEIKGQMIVQVPPTDKAAIVLAMQSLGTCEPDHMAQIVQQKTQSAITDALRTAAFRKTFLELNSQKKEFGEDVAEMLQEDLAKLGLKLVTVAVTHIAQGEFSNDQSDVIAAQGRRNVAETVQRNRQETNQITQAAEVKIREQNVNAKEQTLSLDLRNAQKVADQARTVAEYEAEQATKRQQAVLLQEQAAAEAKAAQERAVAEAQAKEAALAEAAGIAKAEAVAIRQSQADASMKAAGEKAAIDIAKAQAERKVAEEEAARQQKEAEIARQKAVEAAAIAKEQAVKVASQQQQQAIETAEVARQVAVAQKRAEEAQAKAKQAEQEALQKGAEQKVVTVQAEAEADRQRRIVVIKAEEEAAKDKVAADKDAYIAAKMAEGERDAAMKRAEALKAKAEGEAEALRAQADGYADNLTTRANAEGEAADKQATAKIKLAEAALREGEAAAQSRRLMVEAENQIGLPLVIRDVAVALIGKAPDIMHELMAPVAKVAHDVKVLQINGLGGGQDGSQSIPGTIMGTGLALSGALPILREMVEGVVKSEDVQAMAGQLTGVVKAALKESVGGVAEGLQAGKAKE